MNHWAFSCAPCLCLKGKKICFEVRRSMIVKYWHIAFPCWINVYLLISMDRKGRGAILHFKKSLVNWIMIGWLVHWNPLTGLRNFFFQGRGRWPQPSYDPRSCDPILPCTWNPPGRQTLHQLNRHLVCRLYFWRTVGEEDLVSGN